ncbi:MAG: hypothetical protein BJ554DRAFT_1495 [Olpidium bornovanus]|uniref:Uncharacterized protein n=1 Tax=Olpidium bornovanus TaxID=278681 RepID=A0A8H8DHD8_9FUNG|nr:MAG: hypothetical protein BJ554DRAFT_1495 [Olpidium bornovanus]
MNFQGELPHSFSVVASPSGWVLPSDVKLLGDDSVTPKRQGKLLEALRIAEMDAAPTGRIGRRVATVYGSSGLGAKEYDRYEVNDAPSKKAGRRPSSTRLSQQEFPDEHNIRERATALIGSWKNQFHLQKERGGAGDEESGAGQGSAKPTLKAGCGEEEETIKTGANEGNEPSSRVAGGLLDFYAGVWSPRRRLRRNGAQKPSSVFGR